jgi:UDP-N-acetylmuramate--alanine ligase
VKLSQFEHIYFLGIGGIGMSALARYFNVSDKEVSGYDRASSKLTDQLVDEGISIHFEDFGDDIIQEVPNKEKTLAGTHGKTTTSAMLAHVLMQTEEKCNAFLGGISTNYNTNLIIEKDSNIAVVEADEFDKSFLKLSPFASILTSTDADHLDIYKNADSLKDAFQEYADLIPAEGCLVLQHDISLDSKAKIISYGVNTENENVAFRGNNLRVEDGYFLMDVETPKGVWEAVQMGVPGIHNAENALGVIALCDFLGFNESVIREGLSSFQGVKRRFEYHIRNRDLVFIDDYAHHPTAINSLIASVRLVHPDLPITAVFQPHLFSRTADFLDEFAASLDLADQVYLLPIYPAREQPIPGVTSEAIIEKMNNTNAEVLDNNSVLERLEKIQSGVVLTIGAGSIDQIVQPIKEMLS